MLNTMTSYNPADALPALSLMHLRAAGAHD
jgi:hypothetical protein